MSYINLRTYLLTYYVNSKIVTMIKIPQSRADRSDWQVAATTVVIILYCPYNVMVTVVITVTRP